MKQMNRKDESISDAKFDIGVWPEEACYMTAHRCSTWPAGMDASDTVTFHNSFVELRDFVERYNAWARFEENSWRFEIYFRGATVHYILNRDAFLAGAAAVSSTPQPRIVSDVSRPPRTLATHSTPGLDRDLDDPDAPAAQPCTAADDSSLLESGSARGGLVDDALRQLAYELLASAAQASVGATSFDTPETFVSYGASPADVRPDRRTLSEAQTELNRLPVRIYVHPSAWDALPKSGNGRVNGGLGLGGIPRLIFSSRVFRDLVRSLASSDKRVCFVRTREHATHVIATVKAGLTPSDYPTRVCMYGAPEDDRNIYMFEAARDHTKGGLYVPPTKLAVEILRQIYHIHDI